jgi:hypothetical protein
MNGENLNERTAFGKEIMAPTPHEACPKQTEGRQPAHRVISE